MSIFERQLDTFFNNPFFDDFDLMIRPRRVTQNAMKQLSNIACDVKETPTHFIITADLPGMKKEDIKLEVKDGVLSIKGEVKEEKEEKGEKFYMKERKFGSFERKFQLPKNVDWNKIKAEYKDGILNTLIPKREEEKPMEIQIQ